MYRQINICHLLPFRHGLPEVQGNMLGQLVDFSWQREKVGLMTSSIISDSYSPIFLTTDVLLYSSMARLMPVPNSTALHCMYLLAVQYCTPLNCTALYVHTWLLAAGRTHTVEVVSCEMLYENCENVRGGGGTWDSLEDPRIKDEGLRLHWMTSCGQIVWRM
jgi:hypothetical protein